MGRVQFNRDLVYRVGFRDNFKDKFREYRDNFKELRDTMMT